MVSVLRYKAADGLPLEAVLTLPPGRDAKGLPLVVLAHEGPGERVLPGFDWLAEAFASRGYAVLAPNFRGSGGFGKSFRDAGFNEWGRKMQTDLTDGVDALAAAGLVDPAKVCVIGIDYGAYAALAGVTLQHGRYRCAVAFGGVYDLGGVLAEKSSPFDQVDMNYWRTFIGAEAVGTNLDKLSPAKRAADADAPVMLVDTKANWTMVIVQSPQMERALRQAGKPVERVVLDGDDWRLRDAATRMGLLRAAVPFVERLNPSQPPSPTPNPGGE